MESTHPQGSFRITIKRKYIIINKRAGIAMLRKKSFDVNTIKTIKTIFCSDPHKPIFILNESMNNSITQPFSISKAPEIKGGGLRLCGRKKDRLDEKKQYCYSPTGDIYYGVAAHYYLKFTKKPGKQKFPVTVCG